MQRRPLTEIGKTAPSEFLHKQLDITGMAPDIDSNSPDMYSVAFVGFDDDPAWVDSKRK